MCLRSYMLTNQVDSQTSISYIIIIIIQVLTGEASAKARTNVYMVIYEYETRARVFSETLAHGNNKNEWSEYGSNEAQPVRKK